MPSHATYIRFGTFQLDISAAELHKNGVRVRLQQQPAQLLETLLERPGQVVTRDELRQRLWPEDTFVDFEHGLNAAVKRLREALGDSADNPVFIETLPRRGYRFIAPVESAAADLPVSNTESGAGGTEWRHDLASSRRRTAAILTSCLLLVLVVAAGYAVWKFRHAVPANPIRSLAVLPLQDLSSHPQTEYFGEGMTEALITELGKIRGLRVISHHSVMKYKDTTKSVPEIAKELNVDGVVEGGVLLGGQQVRVTVQLIAANPEQHLWAESYERDLRDIVFLQGDLARDVAGQIRMTALPKAGQPGTGSERRVNVEAYNAYLQGRFYYGRLSEENVAKAIAYYERAVALDPTYAPAWASLGEAREFQTGGYGPAGGCGKAKEAAQRALALDPDLAQAHVAMGNIQMYCDFDWSGAEVSYQKALAVEPGNVQALQGVAAWAATLGRFEEAVKWNRRTVEVNPLDATAWHNLALNAAAADRQNESLEASSKSLELNPQQPWSHFIRADIYFANSRTQEGLAEIEQEVTPVFRLQGLATAYYRLGRNKESDAKLAELIATYHQNAALQIAEVYAVRGETDEAFRWLDTAYAQRDGGLPLIKSSEPLNRLKSDPRYTAFLQRMKLPP